MSTYSVRPGDTLSKLAAKFHTSVNVLVRLNHIKNPNLIRVGQKLTIPDGAAPPGLPPPSRRAPSSTSGRSVSPGRTVSTSSDGTPLFRQGDARWAGRTLGRRRSISDSGCAMTATAMAISKIGGKVIDPGELDAYLDAHGGYTGDAIIWGNAARMAGLGASKPGWSMATLNKQVDAGRPVVIGVDYKPGGGGGSNGTDHWVTVTHRQGNTYFVNDPATGRAISLHLQNGRLVGGPRNYKSTGELVVFSGGGRGRLAAKESIQSPTAAPVSLEGLTLPAVDLREGSRGPGVEQLQRALVKTGHLSQANMNTGPGLFGPKTRAALRAFQSAHGVPSTGNYGPLTRAAFEKLGARMGGGTKGGVTLAQLRAIMPHLSQTKAQQYLPYLNAAMAEADINTPKRQAAFLAQLAHESGELRYMEEIASGAAYEGRKDLGNIHPGDGKRYKGRGPIQLTGRANYRAAGKALGIDLENNPKRAADPDVGFRTAAWFWKSRKLNSYADAGNFREITRRINGGYNGLASREAYYKRALRVLA